MSEKKYESQVKEIPYTQEMVYNKLSDLNNFAIIKERLSDPQYLNALAQNPNIKADELERISKTVSEMNFDTDSISCNVPPLGQVALRVIERDMPKCIKFETEKSPIHLNLWIQLLPVTASSCKMKLTVGADLNMFIRGMVEKPLKEGVERLATMLASIPYDF